MRPGFVVGMFVLGTGFLWVAGETRTAPSDVRFQKVGQTTKPGILVSTGQLVSLPPDTLTYGARPVDMVLSRDGAFAYVKDTAGLTVVDLKNLKIVSQTPIKGGASLYGIALSPDGTPLPIPTRPAELRFSTSQVLK